MDSLTSNLTIFEDLVKPVVDSFLEGINDTIITYGPTGSGKTFTMIGDEVIRKNLCEITDPSSILDKGQPGILLYGMDYIFKHLQTELATSLIKVSYIEIYNDGVYDLLQEKSTILTQRSISEIESGKFVLKGVIQQSVKNVNEVIQAIRKGERNRHYAENIMNHNSSRSHTIFQIKLKKISQTGGLQSEIVLYFFI